MEALFDSVSHLFYGRKENMQEQEEQESGDDVLLPPRSRKKLKSSDCDLTIKLKWSKGEQQQQKSYEVHSVIMACHSEYFDSLLKSGFSEAQSKIVILENVAPHVFELAMELLEDPVKASVATIEQIVQVTPFYNRFLFTKGMEFAKAIMLSYMEGHRKNELNGILGLKTKPFSSRDLDRIIDVILIADETDGLEEIKELGIKYIDDHFDGRDNPLRLASFTLEHWRRLHRFLVANFERTIGMSDVYMTDVIEDEDFPSILYKNITILSNAWTIGEAGTRIQVSMKVKRLDDASSSVYLSSEHILEYNEGDPELAFGWSVRKKIEWSPQENVRNVKIYPCIDCYQAARSGEGAEILDWVIDVHLDDDEKYKFVAPNSSHHSLPPAYNAWGKTIGGFEFVIGVKHLFSERGDEEGSDDENEDEED